MTDYVELFNDSYEYTVSLASNSDQFFARFYEIFIGNSDEIAEKFHHTDLTKQAEILKKSIAFMVNFHIKPEINDYLTHIAVLHDKQHLNIEPRFYQQWIDALVNTIAEFYPHFNHNVEIAWRIVFSPGIAFMQYHYDLD